MYSKMREKFINGLISEEERNDFCTAVLFEIMQEDEIKAVFERLANI